MRSRLIEGQQIDLDLAFTTTAGEDLAASGTWAISQEVIEESSLKPKGLIQYDRSLNPESRWHVPEQQSGSEDLYVKFEMFGMYYFGPGQVQVHLSSNGAAGDFRADLTGTDIVNANAIRNRMTQSHAAFFQTYDLLVSVLQK